MADERVGEATRQAERAEADQAHNANQTPTPEEERAAERAAPASEEASEAYQDYLDTAKDVKGEGEIEGS